MMIRKKENCFDRKERVTLSVISKEKREGEKRERKKKKEKEKKTKNEKKRKPKTSTKIHQNKESKKG